jgi:predicted amidophosphoribosyltransferase
MCGCMLMHAAMDHEEHGQHPSSGTAPMHDSLRTWTGKTCGHCGFPLGSGFAFCPNCGMRLGAANCPACGQKVESSWKSCAYCGSPLGDPERQAAHDAM